MIPIWDKINLGAKRVHKISMDRSAQVSCWSLSLGSFECAFSAIFVGLEAYWPFLECIGSVPIIEQHKSLKDCNHQKNILNWTHLFSTLELGMNHRCRRKRSFNGNGNGKPMGVRIDNSPDGMPLPTKR